ncbi:MAG TPA: hypothetical protein VF721_09310 [Pyrinomonadaceae bacterium]|jgi:hypothetical protein
MKNPSILKIVFLLAGAAGFGALYWLFLETIQPSIVNRIYNCDYCDRCANVLYNKEQIILAFCAALAGAVAGLLNARGFRGVLKTIAAGYLCFQFYSLLTIWSVVRAEECTALHRPRIFPLVALGFLIVDMLIRSGVWAFFCAVPLLIFSFVQPVFFGRDDDFQRLDLGLK